MILPAIVLGSLLYAVIDDYNNPPKPAKSAKDKLVDALREVMSEQDRSGQD